MSRDALMSVMHNNKNVVFFLFVSAWPELHVLHGDVCRTSSWKSSQLGNHGFMVKFIRQALRRMTGQRPLVDNLPRPRHGLSRIVCPPEPK